LRVHDVREAKEVIQLMRQVRIVNTWKN
jgi:hypothetical protein